MPGHVKESVTFLIPGETLTVNVTVARERDLCVACRQEIVAKGKPA